MTVAAPPASPLVEIEDIRLTLGSAAGPVEILRGVSLTLAAGETVALLGPSGSGKSTLMMVMAGFGRARSRRVTLARPDFAGVCEDRPARVRPGHSGNVVP